MSREVPERLDKAAKEFRRVNERPVLNAGCLSVLVVIVTIIAILL